ncbi:MAG: fibrobacter succinogenes major paralogous domain-containing protein, partial [Bacteroidales bacterium]|nr:fibrobacter succinogenes major paralogous domain-containing protein [Bacteroidales bacterium]
LNTTTEPQTVTFTVRPTYTANGISCEGTDSTFTVTVNPTIKANTIADQVVCNNGTTTEVTFGTNATGDGTVSYAWSNDNTSIGLGASGTTNKIASFTATNSTSEPVVATITVTPTYTYGGESCVGTPTSFTITVNPTAAVVDDIADQVVCNNTSTTAVTFSTTNTGGTTTYSWTNNNTSIGLAASGSGNIAAFTARNTGTSPVTATITVTPHFANGNVTCDGTAKTFTITVNPTANVNTVNDQVVCNGENTTKVEFGTTNTGGTTTYTWVNNTPSIGLDASGTGNIASFTAVNTGTAPVTATITVTPRFANDGVTCDGTAKTFTITVNPTANVNTVGDQVVCNGDNTIAVSFGTTNTGGTTTYTWVNNTPSIGLDASGTGNIASFTAVNTGTAPVTATITVTPHFANNGVTCNGPTKQFTITVNPTAQVNNIGDQVVCNNASTTAVTFSTANTGGTTSYSWVNDTPGIGLAASGNGNIASFTAVNTSTAPVTATITVTPRFANDGVTCDGTAKTFTITVNPTANVNTVGDQVVCNGDNTTAVTFGTTNTGGTTTYSWTNNMTSIGLAANGSGNIAAFAAKNTGALPVTATITVTPHFTNGSVTCDGTAKTFTITVNPTANVNTVSDQVVCNGDNTTAVTFGTTNTGGTTTYTWVNDTPDIGLAASGNGNIAAFAAANTGTAPVTATITVTPHFANAGVTCDGPTKQFTITVNPAANVNTVNDQVVCNGDNTTAVTFGTTNTGGTTTYTWVNNTPSIGLDASGTGNIASFTAVNTGTAPVTAIITVTPRFANGGITCDGTAKTFTITVNPTAQVNTLANQTICNGTPTTAVTFGTTNTGGTTTYTWENDTPGIGLAASGNGNIAAFTAANTGTAPVTATITVTPHFANGDVTCDGPTKQFTITVNPTPTLTVSPASAQNITYGDAMTGLSIENTASSLDVTLTHNGTTKAFADAGLTYDAAAKTVTGTPNAIGTYVITATAHSTYTPDCGTLTQSVTVNVAKRDLYITIDDTRKYDGTPLETNYNSGAVTTNGLQNGASLNAGAVTTPSKDVNTYTDNTGANITTAFATTDGISNYNVHYNFTQEITPRIVHIATASDSKFYDGTPLTNPNYSITGDGFVVGEVTNIHTTGSVTAINTCEDNTIVYTPVTGLFNAANYTIDTTLGQLCIVGSDRPITITSASANGLTPTYDVTAATPITYDGTTHGDEFKLYKVTYDGVEVPADAGSNGLVFTLPTGDKLTVTPTFTGVTNVADANNTNNNNTFTYTITNNGVDMESAYVGQKTLTPGTVKIKTRNLVIKLIDSKVYDGTKLIVTVPAGGLQNGTTGNWTISGLANGEYITSGTVETESYIVGDYFCNENSFNDIMSMVAFQSGFDVSSAKSNYTPEFDVKLSITTRSLVITAKSATKEYDGTLLSVSDLTAPGYDITSGTLATDDAISSISLTGEILCVGDSASRVSNAVIMHGTGSDAEDVTDSYTITYVNGHLVVTPVSTSLVCPANLNITLWYGRCDTMVTLPAAATLTPAVANTTIVNDLALQNPLPVGTHHITWNLLDACGNVMQSCTQTVTVQFPPCEPVFLDGRTYSAERIGCDCWITENLRNEHYSDGTDIANFSSYRNSSSMEETYGKLYSWYSAVRVPEGNDTQAPADSMAPTGAYVQGICPQGWALPTMAEYQTMFQASGGVAGLVKSPSSNVWLPGKQGTAPNSFNAFGAGYYDANIGRYTNLLGEAHFWTSDYTATSPVARNFVLNYYCEDGLDETADRDFGFSIRCVRKK